jgi:hypothetical protein
MDKGRFSHAISIHQPYYSRSYSDVEKINVLYRKGPKTRPPQIALLARLSIFTYNNLKNNQPFIL